MDTVQWTAADDGAGQLGTARHAARARISRSSPPGRSQVPVLLTGARAVLCVSSHVKADCDAKRVSIYYLSAILTVSLHHLLSTILSRY